MSERADRFLDWLLGHKRTCMCCAQSFRLATDEALFGVMVCRGCAWAIKRLRAQGDLRFAIPRNSVGLVRGAKSVSNAMEKARKEAAKIKMFEAARQGREDEGK